MQCNKTHFPGAMYHVMLRGNNKQNIFFQAQDFDFFLERLRVRIEKYGVKVHLFCLMTNHVHLVIEVDKVPLTKVMQSLQTSFTLTINKRHNRCGHLSQGRFIEKLIQNEKYLLELCYYIHNNPVKAKLVQNIDEYYWSSHQAYIEEQFGWVTTNRVNALINKHAISYYKTYLDFICDRNNSFATPKFFELDKMGMLKVNDSLNKANELSNPQKLIALELDIVIKKSCEQFGLEPNKLCSESSAPKVVMVRSVIAYIAHYFGGYYLKDIAHYFGRAHASFSRTTHNNIIKIQKDYKLQQRFERVIKALKSKY